MVDSKHEGIAQSLELEALEQNPEYLAEQTQAKLNGETARIPFAELSRWFAQGLVLQVSDGADLVAIATAMALDDASGIKASMDQGQLGPISDEVAQSWFDEKAEVWAVVVRPYILVQSRKGYQ